MPEKYGSHEQATLFALMLARTEVGNPDLKNDYGIELRADKRARLNKDGLIRSWQVKRRFVHQITDDGIAWCVRELSVVEAPDRSGPLPRLVFEVMHRLPQYLRWRDLDFAEVVNRGSLEELIRKAYQELSATSGDWVRLARLRPMLDDVDRDAIDDLFPKMIKTGLVHFAPDSNTKALTEVDHAAAIRVGGEDKHLMAIEEQ